MSINFYSKFKSIVYYNSVFEEIDIKEHKCILFVKFDVRKSLSHEEIDQIISRYFKTHCEIRGEIINRKSNEFKLLSREDILELEDCLISCQAEKLRDMFLQRNELLNYPIHISKENAIFGKTKILKHLK